MKFLQQRVEHLPKHNSTTSLRAEILQDDDDAKQLIALSMEQTVGTVGEAFALCSQQSFPFAAIETKQQGRTTQGHQRSK